MGLVGSWLAVKTADSADVLAELGLVETGEFDFGNLVLDSVAVLNGWTVVFMRDLDFAAPDVMRRLSEHREVVGCQASDIVMYSSAFGHSGGEMAWSVEHDPDKTPIGLETKGRPPAEFEAIRDGALRRQAEEGDEVDHLFDVPIELTAALCGYSPEDLSPPDTVFRAVETIRRGNAGERQGAMRAFRERFTARIGEELFPAAERLGFEPIARHPAFHQFYPRRVTKTFVRFREDQSDGLEFTWAFPDGAPCVGLNFFVRKGAEPRYGRAGHASVPLRPLTLMERFTGRKQDPDVMIEQAIADGREMLGAVDRHLREGAAHPNLKPADYLDERSGK